MPFDYVQDDFNAFLKPVEAWELLKNYKQCYYNKYSAAYSGGLERLSSTAEFGSFWKRNGKCRVHVPIAADIAATSSDMLFSEEIRFTCFNEETESGDSPDQKRLDELLEKNNIHGLLNEAGESCSILGDVYLKLNWRKDELDTPIITVVQGDSAWPEYVLGVLKCIHFFTVYKVDKQNSFIYRMYERYEPNKITMHMYRGTDDDLGTLINDEVLRQLGYDTEIIPPILEMLAVHVPNIKPNRHDRSSNHGRSDCDGLRGLMDSLDETYSSWMRDVRLAKARLIVPAEYLRRRNKDLFDDGSYTYEFDEDVETLVALDIDSEKVKGDPITSVQFEIRSEQHRMTCENLIREIVTNAGFSPQTFGLDIQGNAQSGTALNIREKKSLKTLGKKQTYWQSPLEKIMSALIHLDYALYPAKGSKADGVVKVRFSDSLANDISTTSNALEMLNRAAAASTEFKVEMLHPDWTKGQIDEEVERIKTEQGLNVDEPNMMMGDFEGSNQNENENENGSDEVNE